MPKHALPFCRWLPLVVLAFAAPTYSQGLNGQVVELSTESFNARLAQDAQVLVSLKVSGETFDFLPYDYLNRRSRDGQHHWGDITLRYRSSGGDGWTDANSASSRSPIQSLDSPGALLSGNLANTIPKGPLTIVRDWLNVDGDLALRFTIKNEANTATEIGSLGFPAEFNSIFSGRSPEQMQASCSLSDPYVGLDAGHIRITPVNPVTGSSKALVVTPLNGTKTPFEAYRFLPEPSFGDLPYQQQTFEGFYEWQVHSKAWAEKEWAESVNGQWNTASSVTLEPGESLQYGLRFTVVEDVRSFDNAINRAGVPTALGIPGYNLAQGSPGRLFLQSPTPVRTITIEPSGALNLTETAPLIYTITPKDVWGPVKLLVEYEDGRQQSIHYYITKSGEQALADLGSFLFNKAWYTDVSDPFGRAPSIMSYDCEADKQILQEIRVWVAGLSDEGGTGAYLAGALKQLLQPNVEEVAKLEEFVNETLWGQIQLEDYAVRKSIFFYEPGAIEFQYDPAIPWGGWTSWNRQDSYKIYRAYNYVHPAAVYWTLYRISRAYPDITGHDWTWYLEKAYGTALRITGTDIGWAQMGLMGEWVFGEILTDLQREGHLTEAESLEKGMRVRAEHWHSLAVPFGSEMAWDSTGQEAVYFWSRYFGFTDSMTKTINSVLGYMPSVPHWAWNGNARRYWDFDVAAKIRRIERQVHHYGSALNGQVLLDAFRDNPQDSYLLRVGYAGVSAPILNINSQGCPSAAYHAWPDTQKWDGYTSDYGQGFLGMALNGGLYVAEDPVAGLVAYGGTLQSSGTSVEIQVTSPVRKRGYVGPLAVGFEIDAGVIEQVAYDSQASQVTLLLAQHTDGPQADAVTIWLDSRSQEDWRVTNDGAEQTRGGWKLAFEGSTLTVTLSK